MLAGIMSWGQYVTLLGGAAVVYYGYVMVRFGKVLWKSGPPPTPSNKKRIWHIETQDEFGDNEQPPEVENILEPALSNSQQTAKPGFLFEPGPEERALDAMSLVVDNIEILLENAGHDFDKEKVFAEITQEIASAPVLHLPPYRSMLANVIIRKAVEIARLQLTLEEAEALIPTA
ncbi:hypothetical protein [Chitinophaga silvisoli]|uniref:Uncharacterized protein n=1 Tax=Chitinophaga silvisoli TaxID=2291814 RepID=A0A3E1P2U4_9BACT|nr:hypothetical protein [Chitinophaga silvisoli]RFM34434.1 hypothetical protein DXN04_14230 [Chitinophaga silvisoli]